MEASATATATATATVAADDPYFPIYISSDEDDDISFLGASYNPEEIHIQEAILLSIDSSRAPTAIGASASFFASPSAPAAAGTSKVCTEESPLDRKGRLKLSSEDDPSDSKKRQKRDRFKCAICMEKVQVSEQFLVNHCAHTCCKNCVGRMGDDLAIAEDMQLEEVHRFSAHSGTMACAVCREMIVSLEASWKADNCNHVICTACFCNYTTETVAKEKPDCPIPSCKSQFKPEIREVIDVDEIHEVIDVDDDGSLIAIIEIDNGKGKKPCNDDDELLLQEPGQCSRGVTTTSSSDEFYCPICMEAVPAIEQFPIPGCAHAFCVGCVRQYVAAKVEENVLSIGCPDPGCKEGAAGALHPEACRHVIPPELFQRWGAALCDMALGPLRFYCPFRDCSALLVNDGDGDGDAAVTNAECPHCSRMFCARCKVPWHDGLDCAEFQRLGEDERGREDLLLRKVAQESKWQRCPNCKVYVDRVEGCVYIRCRCGHCFCYLCGSTMASSNNHQCARCKRTW